MFDSIKETEQSNDDTVNLPPSRSLCSLYISTVLQQKENKKKAKNNIDAKITKKLTVRVVHQSIGRFINDVQQ